MPTSYTSAQDANVRLVAACHEAMCQVARLHQDDAPGLLEFIQENVMTALTPTSRRQLGYFSSSQWTVGGRGVCEVNVTVDRSQGAHDLNLGMDVLTTLVHEMVHAHCHNNGIKDTSNRGRYHNKRFAIWALTLGLRIAPHETIGTVTPGIGEEYLNAYADIASDLAGALNLTVTVPPTRPQTLTGPTTSPPKTTSGSKYVFARCACETPRGFRTIRVARNYWANGTIRCAICGEAFADHAQRARSDP